MRMAVIWRRFISYGRKVRLGTTFGVYEACFGKKLRLGVVCARKSTPNRKNLPKRVDFASKTVPNRFFLPDGWTSGGFAVLSMGHVDGVGSRERCTSLASDVVFDHQEPISYVMGMRPCGNFFKGKCLRTSDLLPLSFSKPSSRGLLLCGRSWCYDERYARKGVPFAETPNSCLRRHT